MNWRIHEIMSNLENYRSSNGDQLRVLMIGSREGITETMINCTFWDKRKWVLESDFASTQL